MNKTLDELKVGSKYQREVIFNAAETTGFKSWKEINTATPELEFGMGSDNNRLIIALTPKDGHYIGVTSHNGDFHLFESVLNKEKQDIYQKVR